MLLTLLLAVSVLIIGAAVAAPKLAFQIKRDREEELVHRGVQYTRAVRAYAKRTGRYPVRAEDLLGGPDQRFIRKLYKDPITKGDFQLLHLGDVQPRAANLNTAPSIFQNGGNGTDPDQTANPAAPADPASGSADSSQNNPQPNAPRGTPITGIVAPSSSGASENQPGMLIFGVVSKSKARSIREFDHKDHYNDWLFFYDPRVDRGYEIKGPTSLPPSFPIQGQSPGLTPSQTQFGGPGTQQNPTQIQPQSTPQQP